MKTRSADLHVCVYMTQTEAHILFGCLLNIQIKVEQRRSEVVSKVPSPQLPSVCKQSVCVCVYQDQVSQMILAYKIFQYCAHTHGSNTGFFSERVCVCIITITLRCMEHKIAFRISDETLTLNLGTFFFGKNPTLLRLFQQF